MIIKGEGKRNHRELRAGSCWLAAYPCRGFRPDVMYIKIWKTAVEGPARSIEKKGVRVAMQEEEEEEVEEEEEGIPPKSWEPLMRDAARGTSSIYLQVTPAMAPASLLFLSIYLSIFLSILSISFVFLRLGFWSACICLSVSSFLFLSLCVCVCVCVCRLGRGRAELSAGQPTGIPFGVSNRWRRELAAKIRLSAAALINSQPGDSIIHR